MDLESLLRDSHAHPRFKEDVRAFSLGQPAPRVLMHGRAPRVKVLRVVTQLLASEPALRVESVAVAGVSGCCDFRGHVTIVAERIERTWEFVWDCRWRAEQAGYIDHFGWPDQARAAREFEWQCFAAWSERVVPSLRSTLEDPSHRRAVEPCA
jgi:hypothetical protein